MSERGGRDGEDVREPEGADARRPGEPEGADARRPGQLAAEAAERAARRRAGRRRSPGSRCDECGGFGVVRLEARDGASLFVACWGCDGGGDLERAGARAAALTERANPGRSLEELAAETMAEAVARAAERTLDVLQDLQG